MSKNFSIEIKWALRFTLLTLAWAIGEKTIGLHDEYIAEYGMYTNLFVFPAFLFFYLALKEKKKYVYNNSMSFREGFVSGLVLSFIIALLNPFAQFVIYKSITPHFFDTIIAYKVEHKYMTLANAKVYFNLKTYIIESSFTALSKGFITGAIVSVFLRNKR
ncbi:DUF4199 domain-containing protein [Flavobacterium wongokense]|uniref:DUF4199 domain-containing protein n=1 Tax=Flavobacterium wongokense TaxID=2910674 RepID=UPI001F2642E9|nr:DUF4199 domain-containing protein [Flavobacterium sp. WG47]